MTRIVDYIRALSPITFLSSIISAMIGASVVYYVYHCVDLFKLSLIMLLLVLIHSGINLYNDYRDYVTGVDVEYRRKHVLHRLNMIIDLRVRPSVVRNVSLILSVASAIVGSVLLINLSILPVVVLVILGLLIGLGYSSPRLKLRYRGMGEIMAGVATGPIIACGSFIVLSNSLNILGIFLSTIAGLCNGLFTTLILIKIALARYDVDSVLGKRTLPVVIGRDRAVKLMYVFIFLIYVIPPILFVLGYLSLLGLLSIVTLPLTLKYVRGGRPFNLFLARLLMSILICLGFVLH
ncbi:MAG: prenyltransferase [Crenarchaeota archaeon]|nr:prenyltransferase [Thermoproteota archaeon]